jgi:hypothetical protein
MKIKTWKYLYNIRKDLIFLHIEDKNPQTRQEIDVIIQSISKLIDKTCKK